METGAARDLARPVANGIADDASHDALGGRPGTGSMRSATVDIAGRPATNPLVGNPCLTETPCMFRPMDKILPGIPARPAVMAALSVTASVVLTGGAAAQAGSGDPVFTVRADRLACVIEHAAQYFPSNGRSAFISLEDCPETGNPFLSSVTNSGPDIEFGEAEVDRFLLLRVEDFACLEALDLPDGAEIVRFYPTRCEAVAGE